MPQGGAQDAPRAQTETVAVTPEKVEEFLGAPYFMRDEEMDERTQIPGVAIGLSWTAAGGEILYIEASQMFGKKGLTLTGQLGDVMKESAQTALSWVRAHARQLGHRGVLLRASGPAPPRAGRRHPQGRPLGRHHPRRPRSSRCSPDARCGLDVAMTGEMTLSGRVLPVGGIKEKVLAAHRLGVKEVLLPKRNEKAVKEDIPDNVRNDLKIHLVSSIEEVLEPALMPGDPTRCARRTAGTCGCRTSGSDRRLGGRGISHPQSKSRYAGLMLSVRGSRAIRPSRGSEATAHGSSSKHPGE